MTESKPMKNDELGRYVCVPSDTCLFSPDITIREDGVWVKTGQQWSSAHADCFKDRQRRRNYVASGRNGYNAVDQYRPGTGTGTYGDPLIFRTRKDAEAVARALNEAYEAGRRDATGGDD